MTETEIKELKALNLVYPHFVFYRVKGKAYFNFPQAVVYHSPDGMEFGYRGSGPADAALNILLYFVNGEDALRMHQEFKEIFIATLPEVGGVIDEDDIDRWIDAWMVLNKGGSI